MMEGIILDKKQMIINELKNRDIPLEVKQSILSILEKYTDRVQFVKNFVGLKDILYIEELSVEFFDFPVFLSLNCQTMNLKQANKYEMISSVYENAITDMDEIVRNIKRFFEETNRILFIEVAFIENILTNDDMWKVFHQMNNEVEKEPFELMVRFYRYPEWYDGEYGETVAAFEESLQMLKIIENAYISKTIISLEKKINKFLELNELKKLPSLVNELKTLKKQYN